MTDTTDENEARHRLASLKILDASMTRRQTELKAARKKWADELGEITEEMNGLIDEATPSKLADCKARLDEIRATRERRMDTASAKKNDLSTIQAAIKRIEGAMVELIRSDPSDQVALDLGEQDITPGLAVTRETAATISLALRDERGDGELTPDQADLEAALEQMGVANLSLVEEFADGEEIEEEDDDDEAQAPDF